MIEAIFYARFDQEQGPVVLHQSPSHSIVPPTNTPHDSTVTTGTPQQPILDFSAISAYIIPPQEFCDRLVSVVTNGYRVLGHPVCITDEKYPRNEFIFNFVLVIAETEDFEKYERLVRKLAELGREVESRDGWLSRDEEVCETAERAPVTNRMATLDMVDSHSSTASAPVSRSGSKDAESNSSASEEDDNSNAEAGEDGDEDASQRFSDLIASAAAKEQTKGFQNATDERGSRVSALIEMLMQDLNSYGECLIPIDSSTTLDTKLFPTLHAPPPVKPEHVPLPAVRPLSRLTDSSWDMTLMQILPYIDGINSVSQIAQLADADLKLTRIAIAHLVYYGAVILMDIFHFGAVYAPTDKIRRLLLDTKLLDECARFSRKGESGGKQERRPVSGEDRYRMVELYTNLKHGVALRSWMVENWSKLQDLDVRRLVTIGLVNGLLTRIHRYPVLMSSAASSNGATAMPSEAIQVTNTNGKDSGSKKKPKKEQGPMRTRDLRFAPYLDGLHSLDRICTDLQIPEKQALEELKRWSDVIIVHR
ncbi:MAG: Nitrogen permease regulator 2 [Chrysothrix sp. TS-e1954]|nr:MAG: Nitrogen permease regulator 2 [Chrysothrix sp. TS-e1954]